MIRNAIFYISCIVTFMCITSCGNKNNSVSYFYLSKEEALDVGYPYGSIVYESLQEYSYQNILITSEILEFKQNAEFVTVKQQLDRELLRQWVDESIASFISHNGYNGARKELVFYDYILPDTLVLKYKTSDSLTNIVLESSLIQKIRQNDINYWIIKIVNDSLIGPLTKSEFEAAQKHLNIPDKLKLD